MQCNKRLVEEAGTRKQGSDIVTLDSYPVPAIHAWPRGRNETRGSIRPLKTPPPRPRETSDLQLLFIVARNRISDHTMQRAPLELSSKPGQSAAWQTTQLQGSAA